MTMTWEDACGLVGNEIAAVTTKSTTHPLDSVRDFIDDLKGGHFNARNLFLALGSVALDVFVTTLQGEVDLPTDTAALTTRSYVMTNYVVPLVCSKQNDYGPQNILWGGQEGIVLRMHDKFARIENLYRRYWNAKSPAEESAANEPLADSWLDLVGYSIVGIMLIDGTFECPLKRDLPPPVATVDYDHTVDSTGNTAPLRSNTPNPFIQAEQDPEIAEAFRQFAAHASMPEEVQRVGDDEYQVTGGGTISVHPADDGSHTHVTLTDGEGGVLDVMAAAGVVGIDTDGTVFALTGQRLAVLLSILLAAAEASLDWRNTTIHAEVPREQ